MTKAEQLYIGKAGEEYWARNSDRLEKERASRMISLRHLMPIPHPRWSRWVEVGCGRGHNLRDGDVGVDIDPRQLKELDSEITGIIAPAYNIPLPPQSYPVVFSVGCLMHLPSCSIGPIIPEGHEQRDNCPSWHKAVSEMARISTNYVIIGEYWAEVEKEIEWHGEKGVLWARPYTVPGFNLEKIVVALPPFDENLTFGIFKKA